MQSTARGPRGASGCRSERGEREGACGCAGGGSKGGGARARGRLTGAGAWEARGRGGRRGRWGGGVREGGGAREGEAGHGGRGGAACFALSLRCGVAGAAGGSGLLVRACARVWVREGRGKPTGGGGARGRGSAGGGRRGGARVCVLKQRFDTHARPASLLPPPRLLCRPLSLARPHAHARASPGSPALQPLLFPPACVHACVTRVHARPPLPRATPFCGTASPLPFAPRRALALAPAPW